jgi:hypothetical protein
LCKKKNSKEHSSGGGRFLTRIVQCKYFLDDIFIVHYLSQVIILAF